MTIYTVTRRYTFEAAHFLPYVREGHKCRRMHGHNYEIDVSVSGRLSDTGFVIDFWDLDDIVQPIVNSIDHRTLNDLEGLNNPTAEIIAEWFLNQIKKDLPPELGVTKVRCYETKNCWADAETLV
jgi:6-pyruvoyltetrahydropterin/6-carboxytetrahydropterin synthase